MSDFSNPKAEALARCCQAAYKFGQKSIITELETAWDEAISGDSEVFFKDLMDRVERIR